jgi:hypothetical protein
MFDDVLVERVRGEIISRCREPQLVTRHEPEQITFAAAVRAIALDDLLNFAINLECDPTAMTAALVHHGHLSISTMIKRSA